MSIDMVLEAIQEGFDSANYSDVDGSEQAAKAYLVCLSLVKELKKTLEEQKDRQ